jgi:hypothetical protein
MRLIIVTKKIDGARVYVNPENICAVYPGREAYCEIWKCRERKIDG